MSVSLLLIILLVLMVVGGAPVFPHSRGYGWAPSGLLGVILVVLVVLLLMGRI